jgi:prepilin signal peptidase PulO-like enzyme (type II secretory pathway)
MSDQLALLSLASATAISLGALLASFLICMGDRLLAGRRGHDLLVSSSRCDQCGRPIRIWALVPIIGWLVSRGRTDCGKPLPSRYIAIELITALAALAALYPTWLHSFVIQDLSLTRGTVLWVSLVVAGALLVQVSIADVETGLVPAWLLVALGAAACLVRAARTPELGVGPKGPADIGNLWVWIETALLIPALPCLGWLSGWLGGQLRMIRSRLSGYELSPADTRSIRDTRFGPADLWVLGLAAPLLPSMLLHRADLVRVADWMIGADMPPIDVIIRGNPICALLLISGVAAFFWGLLWLTFRRLEWCGAHLWGEPDDPLGTLPMIPPIALGFFLVALSH